MGYRIAGDVTLVCDGCGRSRTYAGDARVDGEPLLSWWLTTRGERCSRCFVAGLSDPGADSTGYVRRGAHETERAAALHAYPSTGTKRLAVLEHVLARGEATDDETEVALGWRSQSVTPRRLELVEGGWLEDSGRTRPTRTGAAAIVWIPTARALEATRFRSA